MWEQSSHTYRATVSHPFIDRFVWGTWSPGWSISGMGLMNDVTIRPNSPSAPETTLMVRPYTGCNCENWLEWTFVGRLSDPRGWRHAAEIDANEIWQDLYSTTSNIKETQ
jgi:hypothetical protein